MHEIVVVVPMVPSKNLIGKAGWWRNAHNDRVVWESVVTQVARQAEADPRPPYRARVVCDWQARPMPLPTEKVKQEIAKLVRQAMYAGNGFVLDQVDVEMRQTGRGAKGETRIYLERA